MTKKVVVFFRYYDTFENNFKNNFQNIESGVGLLRYVHQNGGIETSKEKLLITVFPSDKKYFKEEKFSSNYTAKIPFTDIRLSLPFKRYYKHYSLKNEKGLVGYIENNVFQYLCQNNTEKNERVKIQFCFLGHGEPQDPNVENHNGSAEFNILDFSQTIQNVEKKVKIYFPNAEIEIKLMNCYADTVDKTETNNNRCVKKDFNNSNKQYLNIDNLDNRESVLGSLYKDLKKENVNITKLKGVDGIACNSFNQEEASLGFLPHSYTETGKHNIYKKSSGKDIERT